MWLMEAIRSGEGAFEVVGDYVDKLKDVLDHSWEINHNWRDNAYNSSEHIYFAKETDAIFWDVTGNYYSNAQTVSESL